MEEMAEKIRVCVRCPLWEKRKNAVPGDGDIDASVLFVGEAPGYWEDIKGLPFVGAAGKVLDALLEKIELRRESVFVLMWSSVGRLKIVSPDRWKLRLARHCTSTIRFV